MAKQNRRLATNICGKRVKLARVEAGMNQLQLATALNLEHNLQVDQNSISLIEKGARFVKDYEITALAEVLNITPLWFLYGDDQPDFRASPIEGR
jgi:transcriptional regulator with XRE-family HTH domain